MTETFLHHEVLTEWRDVQRRSDEWCDLFNRAERATPFQSFTWADIWWRLFGKDNPLLSLCVVFFRTASNHLVGLSPLMFRREGNGFRIQYLTAPFADYHDSLYLPGSTHKVFTSLEAYLSQQELQRHVLLEEISSRTEVAALFSNGHVRPSKWLWHQTGWCIRINLSTEDPRQLGFIRNEYLRKYGRLARRSDLRIVHHVDKAAMLDHLPTFIDMHRRQWQERVEVIAGFDDAGITDFYTSMCNEGCARKADLKPILSELRWGNSSIAFYFGFLAHHTYMGYRTTFEKEMARESPGHLFLTLLCEDLKQRGFISFDLMRGDYGYKKLYGSYRIPQGSLELFS
jgi:CelD/BcsL family acetyltransferase involved in cellulose biosynthesis